MQNWDLKPGRLTPRPAITPVFCPLISHNYQYFIGNSITQHPGLRSANRGTGIIVRGRTLPGSSALRSLCPGGFAGLVSAPVLLELRASQRTATPLPVPPEKLEAMAPPGRTDSPAMGGHGHAGREEHKSGGTGRFAREKPAGWPGGGLGAVFMTNEDYQGVDRSTLPSQGWACKVGTESSPGQNVPMKT